MKTHETSSLFEAVGKRLFVKLNYKFKKKRKGENITKYGTNSMSYKKLFSLPEKSVMVLRYCTCHAEDIQSP